MLEATKVDSSHGLETIELSHALLGTRNGD